ncbi:MAG: hypothetical protein J5472_01975 [Clostridia bacterium]|nr:hypothetical protein [Clostridia bacterium]
MRRSFPLFLLFRGCQRLITAHQFGDAATFRGGFDGHSIRFHHGAVILPVGGAQLRRHGQLVVQISQGSIGIQRPGIQNGLGGLFNAGLLRIGGRGPGKVVIDDIFCITIIALYGRLVRLSQDATEGKDVSQEQLTVTDALDTMVKWFCILFNNQFTPDEVYDNYPADRLMHDIALALMAVQTQTTEVLDSFPTIPVVQEAEQILAEAENQEVKTAKAP